MYNVLKGDITQIIIEAVENKKKKIKKEEVIKKLMLKTGWKKETSEKWINTAIELGFFKEKDEDTLILPKLKKSIDEPIDYYNFQE